jgi:hypothetical protein
MCTTPHNMALRRLILPVILFALSSAMIWATCKSDCRDGYDSEIEACKSQYDDADELRQCIQSARDDYEWCVEECDSSREYDSHLQSTHRSELASTQKDRLDGYENHVVSLTGWLMLACAGPPETTNCGMPCSTTGIGWCIQTRPNPTDLSRRSEQWRRDLPRTPAW